MHGLKGIIKVSINKTLVYDTPKQKSIEELEEDKNLRIKSLEVRKDNSILELEKVTLWQMDT